MQKNIVMKSNVNISLKTILEGNNVINKNTTINNSNIGFATYFGENCYFANTQIGKYCSIASNVKTAIGTHPTNTYVSTHPAFFSNLKQAGFSYVEENTFKEQKYADEENKVSIIIGNDVWIGDSVLILEGVKIGDGAVIGAGSVITKDIEPYSINVGVPARKIKQRFENDQIHFLQEFQWWNKDQEWIKHNIKDFKNIKVFKERNEKK